MRLVQGLRGAYTPGGGKAGEGVPAPTAGCVLDPWGGLPGRAELRWARDSEGRLDGECDASFH